MPTRRNERLLSGARLAAVLAAGAVAIYLPYRLPAADLKLYTQMGLAALVAIGLSLLMGFAGQISLGQGAFYALGAYTAGVLAVPEKFFKNGQGWDPLLALAAAPLATAAVAAVIGVPLLRLRGHYLAFATLALHLIAIALIFAEEGLTGGQDPGLLGIPPLKVAGHELGGFTHQEIYGAVVWGIVLVALLAALNLVNSRAGRGLQAIAVSEASAAAAGIKVAAYKQRLFVLSAGLAGLAGGLYAFLNLFLSPDAFPIILSIEFVVMVAVGGMGSVYGAVVGAITIIWLRDRLQQLGTHDKLLGIDLPVQAPAVFSIGVFGLILVSVMLFFPRGLLPALTSGLRRSVSAAKPGP